MFLKKMKILAVADVESKYYWDFFEKSKLEGIDLIISAGDLDPHYLSFLATYSKCPVLYVHGNHDYKYEDVPPDGCESIEDRIYEYKGVRIMGLGGSMKYNYGNESLFQYTEKQMAARLRKLRFKLWKSKGIDILVTHSPAFGLHDGEDLPHMGFKCFYDVLDKHGTKLFIHGHVHRSYGRQFTKEYSYKDIKVVNAFERCIIDYEPERGEVRNVQ